MRRKHMRFHRYSNESTISFFKWWQTLGNFLKISFALLDSCSYKERANSLLLLLNKFPFQGYKVEGSLFLYIYIIRVFSFPGIEKVRNC